MGWGRERLSALLETVVFELDAGTAQVKEISKFDGDASVTIRKGDKKFAVFDLSVTCKWEGEMEGTDGAVKGEIKLTEFASTNDEDEYEFVVTCSEGDAAAKEALKKKISAVVAAAFQPHLATFAKELAEM
jgi:activator of HSP90 ATPase